VRSLTDKSPPALRLQADLLAILELPVLVVLDEAYIEFASEPSRLAWVTQRHNLVVLRTFSKSAGEGRGGRLRDRGFHGPACRGDDLGAWVKQSAGERGKELWAPRRDQDCS
jgi:hypothetical protein